MSEARLEMSADRLRANIAAVRARIAPSTLLFAMKDNAYGHGLEWSARTAVSSGVEWFGAYDVHSALRIRREIGNGGRIFAWATSEDDEIDAALRAEIDLGVGSADYLTRILVIARALGIVARVHLKIDTGLHRNGIRPEDWKDAVTQARAAENDGSIRIVGIWSHIAEASDAEDDASLTVFRNALADAEALGSRTDVVHLTASAAAWWRPELRGSMSRIGAFCYGIRSAGGPELEGLSPVATLTAPVLSVSADGVRIAIGSLDGLPSTLGGMTAGTAEGPAVIRKIGLTESVIEPWSGAEVGQRVWLFGPGAHAEQSATDLAERIDTVGEEILTRLSPRVPRVYVS